MAEPTNSSNNTGEVPCLRLIYPPDLLLSFSQQKAPIAASRVFPTDLGHIYAEGSGPCSLFIAKFLLEFCILKFLMFCVSFTDMSREVKKKTPDKLHELALLL